MGDEWPWGPAKYVTFAQAEAALKSAGFGSDGADVGAAIATAESSRDLTVLNNTPATGDYSVGAWQVNYYGSLYAGRAKAFGTPKSLALAGVGRQAHAALTIYRDAGNSWSPWSTYNSGAYKQYLQGGGGGGTPGGGPSEPTVQEGSTGPAVTTLQLDLDDLGAKLTADGVFGQATLAAVQSFQRSHGLTVDGIAGPQTWAAIYAAINGSTPPLPNPSPGSGPPPPNEPPGGVGAKALDAWSNLKNTTGPVAGRYLARLSAYQNQIRSHQS